MPVLKGTSDNFELWKLRAPVYTLSLYDFLRMDENELYTWKTEALQKFCDKIAQKLIRKNGYFIGFASYNFWQVPAQCSFKYKLRGNLAIIHREFKDKLSTDEIDYWGKTFSNRMALELVGFFGLDDYFVTQIPDYPRNEY